MTGARIASVLLVALAVVGCGGSDGAAGTGAGTSAKKTSTERATDGASPADTAPATTDDTSDAGKDEPPTQLEIAAGARYDALIAAYAPVTARVDFLTAAETLRADAVESGASSDIEKERSGVVKIEVVRLGKVLRAARPKVAAAAVDDEQQRRVRTLMLTAIDRRLEALRELSTMLAAVPDDTVGDSEVRRLRDQWRGSWDAALRAARDATTVMQDARAELGLEPALEESIR